MCNPEILILPMTTEDNKSMQAALSCFVNVIGFFPNWHEARVDYVFTKE